MTKMRIVGCHEVGIKREPSIPELSDEVIETVKASETLNADETNTVWDWQGRQYMKCKTPTDNEGYVYVGAIRPIT